VRTFKLTIAYDGTAFAGSQMQSGQRTVQSVFEDALRPFEGQRVVVHFAGRTDSGVHASGQVISFSLTSSIACDALQRALNVTLPGDVRVMSAEEAPAGFNARFDARSKAYRYDVYNGAVVPPQIRHFVWHVPQGLDSTLMSDAAQVVLGEHDFSGFQAAGGDVITHRREVLVSRVSRSGDLVTYEIAATGFLRHMVRNIVGTLVDIGRGRRPVDDLRRVLELRDRTHASATAPAHGLTLVAVEY
jgi:tRNA pseudouridine38-40 synthase